MPPSRLPPPEDALVAEDSRRQTELTDDFTHLVWLPLGWGWEGAIPVNATHWNLFDAISIYRLKGEAAGLYVEWDFPSVCANNPSTMRFFSSLSVDNSVRQYLTSHYNLCKRLRPVYTEAIGGKPFCKYMAALGGDPRRLQGLFVQMFGHRNAVPCQHCEERYLHTFVRLFEGEPAEDHFPSLQGKSKSDRVHVMAPWFECISLPGFHQGACGNCLYYVEGHKCSYHADQSFASLVTNFRASARISEELGPRKLSPVNCERDSDDLSASLDIPKLRAWQVAEKARREQEEKDKRRKKKNTAPQPEEIGAADVALPSVEDDDKGQPSAPDTTKAVPPGKATKGKGKGKA